MRKLGRKANLSLLRNLLKRHEDILYGISSMFSSPQTSQHMHSEEKSIFEVDSDMLKHHFQSGSTYFSMELDASCDFSSIYCLIFQSYLLSFDTHRHLSLTPDQIQLQESWWFTHHDVGYLSLLWIWCVCNASLPATEDGDTEDDSDKGKLITEESRATGSVSAKVYYTFIKVRIDGVAG